MLVFHKLEEVAGALPGQPRACVAIGNFDGVHQGHLAILNGLKKKAKALGLPAVVLTFFPHPVEVLHPGVKLERLTTTEEKLALLEAQGIDAVLVEKFDAALSELSAEAFFENYLLGGLGAAALHLGFDFRFGKGRRGDTALLRKLCQAKGLSLSVEPSFDLDGQRVSSSSIRELLLKGDTLKASEWLGRPYRILGTVTSGDQRGTEIGFPTANLHYPSDKLIPLNGVYVTRAYWQKQAFASVTNIGVRPTFTQASSTPIRVETHLIDFQSRLYDERIEVDFYQRIRDEVRFPSLDALKKQIAADVALARQAGLSS